MTKGMFDWSKDEIKEFYTDNIERIAKNLILKEGAKEYIDLLKKMDIPFILLVLEIMGNM